MSEKFKEFKAEDTVLIYPCSRKFYEQELEALKNKLSDFCTEIKREHEVEIAWDLRYNRFILFAIDFDNKPPQNKIIDQCAGIVMDLEKELKVQLLDRMNISFKQGQYIQYKELSDLKKLIKNRAITAKTIVFDNLINTIEDLEENWELPLSESWYNRYL
jgi:hypothetical protein